MKEKRKKSVALRYDEKQTNAPRVTATGKGFAAEEIRKIAEGNNVPVLEDVSLVELLSELNINETIPEELYQAVAEVFAFIYRADQHIGEQANGNRLV